MASVTITLVEVDDEVRMSIKTDDEGGISLEHPAHVMALSMVHWARETGEKENG